MKKSITYIAPRPANDPESNNGDGQKRAIEFHMLVIALTDSEGAEGEDKTAFANFMYEYLRPMSEEELVTLIADFGILVKSTELFGKAAVNMLLAKIANGGKEVPSAEEARGQHFRRTGNVL